MLCALPCMGVTSDRKHAACRQGMHSDVHNLITSAGVADA